MQKIKFMAYLLICLASVSMVKATDPEISKAMKDCMVNPDGRAESDFELLEVVFENNVTANMGNEITPFQTRHQPELDWNADENAFYTIVNLDPDAPGADDPFNALLNTWMVGNIPGKDVNSGDILFEYIPAATPRGNGLNRYIILVYKQQSGKLEFDEEHIDKFHFEGRQRFPIEEFVSKYELGRPVASNFYVTQFDPYVLDVYNQLQCCFELNRY